jgi:hypothetical protein
VQVVATGVHGVGLRGVAETGLLAHGQRVHVAAEEDGGAAGVAAAQDGRHGGDLLAGTDLEGESVEGAEDLALRLRQVEADLRFAVDGVP